MLAHTCNPSTQEAEAQDHEFKASLVRPYSIVREREKKRRKIVHFLNDIKQFSSSII
jgi:hypothetical protein